MSNSILRSQLEAAKSFVILRQCYADATERRAEAAAAELVAICREKREVERQLAADLQAVALLENAVAIEESQAPLARAFHGLGYRAHLTQGDATRTKAIQS
jgi:hypothetical protein